MSSVTIKGRIATSALRVGEVVTVERTEQVDGLIARGYAVVVGEPEQESLTGAVTPPEPEPVPEEDVPEPPARSASKADWLAFLEGEGVEVDEDLTRDNLVALWHG